MCSCSNHAEIVTRSVAQAALECELADLETKLERAEKLVTGLAGEKARWEGSIADLEGRVGRLPVRTSLASSIDYVSPSKRVLHPVVLRVLNAEWQY